MDKNTLIDHYINQNKSVSQICTEFNTTKKKFSNLCKKYGVRKSKELQRKARIRSNTSNLDVFVKKAKIIHHNKYDYSKVDYIKSTKQVIIICPIHGEFKQKPAAHLQGFGCQICGGSKKLTQKEFIAKATKIHDKYDYSLVKYKNMGTKITIICPEHGEFRQKPVKHINGQGCPKCKNQLTKEEFISRATNKHNNKYDYSLVKYKNIDSPITVICPKHGEFLTTPYRHLKYGCKLCSIDDKKGNKKHQDDFIKQATKIHGKYDYNLVDYYNSFKHVSIICPEHGVFRQAPYDHLQGKGCQKCAGNLKHTTKEFISKSIEKHGDKYDYSKSNYVNSSEKVIIICPVHGEFEQVALYHYHLGYGCPKCPSNISKPHLEIAEFIGDCIVHNDRTAIAPYEIDILLEDKKIGFEHDGVFYHSYNRIETADERNKHKIKQDLADKNGIRLIQIFEYEWNDKKEIVKSKINAVLGRCNRVFARKCKVVKLSSKDFNSFCRSNHLQGELCTKIRYGLTLNDELVCVVGFNGSNDYECTRLCSKLNTIVVGGASRLFKRFINDYNPKSIISFADRRYSCGKVYEQLGFKRDYCTSPNYKYIKGSKIFSRVKFQKHKLNKQLEFFDPNLTEAENMFNNGYRRLWDSGNIKYSLNLRTSRI